MIAGAGLSVSFGASASPTATVCRAPLEPSMMVTVCCSPGGASLEGLLPCAAPWGCAAAGWSLAGFAWFSATRAIGSPPSGSSWNSAKPAKQSRNRARTVAKACNPVKGSRNRRLRRKVFCPSGALRSSAVSAIDFPESTEADDTTAGQRGGRAPGCWWYLLPADGQKGRPLGPPLWEPPTGGRSVRNLGRRLVVGRGLVVGCGRRRCVRGRVGLDAVQEVVGRLQCLVVLGVRRNIGLRAGLLVAVVLQMAAQRGFAPCVGPRLQLVRHVLQHLDIGHDALGLDRLAGRRVVARRGQAQRAIAAAERNDGLHRSLAERAGADQRRALVVLQRAGDDFRRRSRAAIDQDDERLALGEVARMRRAALGFLGVAAAGRDDLAALEERVGDRDRLLQEPARIVAQVDDVALDLVADLVLQIGDFLLQALGGLLVEGGDAED